MNLFGSYKKLLGNSISAMMAAIEIYNKPKFDYREECFVILLINAWELALKACLSKAKISIYYPKKRNSPYRTLSIDNALTKSEKIWPTKINFNATKVNIQLLTKYRDNAIHFYNQKSISIILYSLSQTAIVNYKDFLDTVFNKNISDEITISLLPLALSTSVDPIALLNKQPGKSPKNTFVRDFCSNLKLLIKELEEQKHDTGRLLTVFNLKLESVKKAKIADITANIDNNSKGHSVIYKKSDPNITHPLLRKDIISSKNSKGKSIKYSEVVLTGYVFQAIIEYYEITKNSQYYWADKTGGIKRYSNDFVTRLKQLTEKQVKTALASYKESQKKRQRHKGTKQ